MKYSLGEKVREAHKKFVNDAVTMTTQILLELPPLHYDVVGG